MTPHTWWDCLAVGLLVGGSVPYRNGVRRGERFDMAYGMALWAMGWTIILVWHW